MINLVLRLLITMAALKVADLLLPNFNLHGGLRPLIRFSIVLGLMNWLVKPIMVFFSVPLIIVSIGLFYLIINALVIYFTSLVIPNVMTATSAGIFLGSILVSIFHWLLTVLFRVREKD